MRHLFARWFGSRSGASDAELRSLREELARREEAIAALRHDLARERRTEDARVAELLRARLEPLLSACALPIAHLLTQAHLVEAADRPVQARDVLVNVKRLVRAFEDQGLVAFGAVGERCAFDTARHEPLAGVIAPGEPVVVRFVGLSYGESLLRKAGVERQEA